MAQYLFDLGQRGPEADRRPPARGQCEDPDRRRREQPHIRRVRKALGHQQEGPQLRGHLPPQLHVQRHLGDPRQVLPVLGGRQGPLRLHDQLGQSVRGRTSTTAGTTTTRSSATRRSTTRCASTSSTCWPTGTTSTTSGSRAAGSTRSTCIRAGGPPAQRHRGAEGAQPDVVQDHRQGLRDQGAGPSSGSRTGAGPRPGWTSPTGCGRCTTADARSR